tara:strand:+ start:451 stop:837 length:387 start_codon:yes stop_codon:yes gene_type:complete
VKSREDYGDSAEQWFAALEEPLASLAAELRTLIQKAAPTASECIKWGVPVYEQSGPICSLRTAKNYIALQFHLSGTQLDDPDGLLEGSGKNMRHVKIHVSKEVKKRQFTDWVKQAAKANQQHNETSRC